MMFIHSEFALEILILHGTNSLLCAGNGRPLLHPQANELTCVAERT